jgi:hypothetical protein
VGIARDETIAEHEAVCPDWAPLKLAVLSVPVRSRTTYLWASNFEIARIQLFIRSWPNLYRDPTVDIVACVREQER